MKQKVKELRVQIDGLGQLTKNISGGRAVDLSLKREDEDMDDFIVRAGKEELGHLLGEQSKQTEKATDSLFLAKAWLGKVLGALGEDSPYPKDGTRKTVEDIEPTADISDLTIEQQTMYASNNSVLVDAVMSKENWDTVNHIEKVDWLRQEIQKVVNELPKLKEFRSNLTDNTYLFRCLVLQHLSEARFHLGFELERIRENEK